MTPRLRTTVDPTLSSTYLLFNSSSNFSTVYVDETTVEGTYFLDTLCIGDACIFSQVMALATEASDRVWRGILGLGLITQESATFSGNSYPTILDTLVRQGVIGARAYSVWLDDYRKNISRTGGHNRTDTVQNQVRVHCSLEATMNRNSSTVLPHSPSKVPRMESHPLQSS